MNSAAIEARKAYRRAWYRSNPEKQKEYQARYWNKKAQQEQGQGDNVT